jgi:hypothetical protein
VLRVRRHGGNGTVQDHAGDQMSLNCSA